MRVFTAGWRAQPRVPLELLPYETEQLFRAADIRHDADDDEDEA